MSAPPAANSVTITDDNYAWHLHPDSDSNLHVEMAAIGAGMMGDNAATAALVELLRPEHYSRRACAVIHKAIATLWKRKQAGVGGLQSIDLIAVGNLLHRQGYWNEKNRDHILPSDLTACIEACPGSANIRHYCEEVVAYSKQRALRALSIELHRQAGSPDADATNLLNSAKTALDNIEQFGYVDLSTAFQPEP